jgi:hypothetical protein
MQRPALPTQRTTQFALPKPRIPTILVHDYTQTPAITTHYLDLNNALSFQSIYTSTKSLLTRPPCPHNPLTTWPCPACESAFLSTYWTIAAHILDYLADFAHLDTALMQSLWFYLLDIWQETRAWLPYEEILVSERVSPRAMQVYGKARWFLEEWKGVRELMDMVIHGVKGGAVGAGVRENILHNPTGDKSTPAGSYNTGPWVSGLSGWRQWLGEGSVGVVEPVVVKTDEDGEEEMEADGDGMETARHVPMPAIAIVKAHTERARRIAAQVNPDAEFLNTFDQHSLHFSNAVGQTHTYTSITGRTTTYQLSNGAPPVLRYYGYGDPNMLCSQQDFNLLDECVAVCRGIEAYEPVSGPDVDEEESDDEDPFDVWTVWEGRDNNGGEGEMEMVEGWGKMFDEWVDGEQD